MTREEAGLSPSDDARRWTGVLPGFIAVSLAAHALTFFLFQIEYPAHVTISAPAPSVSLLDPQRADHQALLRLIEAEDPAPAAIAQSTVPPHLLEVPYRPSYSTVRTLPQTLPEPSAAVQFPPARDPLAVIRSASPAPPEPVRPVPPSQTRLLLGEGLAGRALARPFAITLEKPAAEPLTPARFLLGVTPKGHVRFCFLQSSSGDANADAAAASALDRATFTAADAPMTWSQVTVVWGDDIYRDANAPPQK
jgi:hypothetical protein